MVASPSQKIVRIHLTYDGTSLQHFNKKLQVYDLTNILHTIYYVKFDDNVWWLLTHLIIFFRLLQSKLAIKLVVNIIPLSFLLALFFFLFFLIMLTWKCHSFKFYGLYISIFCFQYLRERFSILRLLFGNAIASFVKQFFH